MFYEGCTIDEIRAFRELEGESFDFGEGLMDMRNALSEDAYYEMCLPEECGYIEDGYEHNYYNPKSKQKYKLNKYYKKQIDKFKLEKLYNIRWWAVSDMETHKRRCYLSDRRKVAKKMSDRKVRKYKCNISNGGNYRKLHDYWWNIL